MIFGVGFSIAAICEQADDLEAIRRTAAYQDCRRHGSDTPFSCTPEVPVMQSIPFFRAASFACSQAAGSVSVTPRATTSWPFLMTSQYQCPSSPLGIIRNSTPFPIVGWVLRPEMMIGVNQDTLYCAALRAHEGAKARLAAPWRNISH